MHDLESQEGEEPAGPARLAGPTEPAITGMSRRVPHFVVEANWKYGGMIPPMRDD